MTNVLRRLGALPPSQRASTLAVALVVLLGGSAVEAHNGEVAYAYPATGIVVDGDLSDWPSSALPMPIPRILGAQPEGPKDLSASFRVAYDLVTRSLLVGVEIVDDVHVVDSGDPEAGQGVWNTQDSHLLYVDAEHLSGGSGNVLYQAGEAFRSISVGSGLWQPWKVAEASPDTVELAVQRRGGKTIYERRIFLGDALRPNRTLGLDHLISDVDGTRPEDEGTLALWGAELSKSANAYRLGDVLLLASGAELGTLEGRVRWQRRLDEPLPTIVRITSKTEPALWLHAPLDAEGGFSVRLPAGDYRVSSALKLSKPFGGELSGLPVRIDQRASVAATVTPNQTVRVGDLSLPTFERPDFLFHEQGVLVGRKPLDERDIDAFVESFRRYYEIPGVSVALVKEGKLVYARTFGVRNALTEEPVEASTLFEAASITKPVFAFAVMRLAERGVIDLDRPLHEYAVFENIADDERSKALTARLVLSHRSGLPNWFWGGAGGWRGGGTGRLDFTPGERFEYSGEAMDYLGRVIEKITGKGLGQVLREEVLIPMSMTNSFFTLDEDQARVASVGHMQDYPVWRARATEPSPASSLHTEARDFANFMIGLIDKKGLKAETYAEMLRPHVEVPPERRVYDDGWRQSVGLGFFLQDTPFGPLLQHGGNNGDFECKFGVLPETGDGYAIFTNGNIGDELVRAFEVFLLTGQP